MKTIETITQELNVLGWIYLSKTWTRPQYEASGEIVTVSEDVIRFYRDVDSFKSKTVDYSTPTKDPKYLLIPHDLKKELDLCRAFFSTVQIHYGEIFANPDGARLERGECKIDIDLDWFPDPKTRDEKLVELCELIANFLSKEN